MAVETADDRATFLADFGEAVTYRLAAGGDTALTGLPDNPHNQATFDNVAVADGHRSVFVRSADLPPGAIGGDGGDRMIVGGVTYRVTELQPDGEGMTLVMLAK